MKGLKDGEYRKTCRPCPSTTQWFWDRSAGESGLSLVDAEERPVWRLVDAMAETRWALDGLHLAREYAVSSGGALPRAG